jgi:PAS domain S-box-containing protein
VLTPSLLGSSSIPANARDTNGEEPRFKAGRCNLFATPRAREPTGDVDLVDYAGELAVGADRNQGMDASEATRDDQCASVTVDRDGIIHQWGDAVTEVVGYSADDTLGQNLNVVVPPVLRPLHWWGFDRAMRRGRLSRGTFKVPALRNDGRIVVARASIELLPGNGGDTTGPWSPSLVSRPDGKGWRALIGSNTGADKAPLQLPPSAESARAAALLKPFPGGDQLPAILVVSRRDGSALTPGDLGAADSAWQRVLSRTGGGPLPHLVISQDGR